MANYYIYISNNLIGEVKGTECAYTAYRRACELADLLGQDCSLIWAETGEIIATTCEEEEQSSSFFIDKLAVANYDRAGARL